MAKLDNSAIFCNTTNPTPQESTPTHDITIQRRLWTA